MIGQEQPVGDFTRDPFKVFVVREDGFGGGVVMLVNLGEPGRAALGIEGAGGPVFSVWRMSSANACVLLFSRDTFFEKSDNR